MGLCAITWALTVFLFFFLNESPEKSDNFYFSLGYTLFLELLFFFYIGFLKTTATGKTRSVFAPVYGIINITYILTGAALLLAWNLFLGDLVSLRFFIGGLIILSVVFIIVGALVGKTQAHHDENLAEEKESASGVANLQAEFARAEMRFASLMKQKGLKYKTDASYGNGLDSLLNQLKFIPANALKTESVRRGLEEVLQRTNGFIDTFAREETTQEQFDRRFTEFLSETRNNLDLILKSSRK